MFKLKSLVKRTGVIYGREGMKVKFVDSISEEVDKETAEYFAKVPGYEILKLADTPKKPATPEQTLEPTPEQTLEPTPEPTPEQTLEPTQEQTLEPTQEVFDEAEFRTAHFRSQVRMIKDQVVPVEFLTVIVEETDSFSPSVLKEAEDRLKEVYSE